MENIDIFELTTRMARPSKTAFILTSRSTGKHTPKEFPSLKNSRASPDHFFVTTPTRCCLSSDLICSDNKNKRIIAVIEREAKIFFPYLEIDFTGAAQTDRPLHVENGSVLAVANRERGPPGVPILSDRAHLFAIGGYF